MERFERGHGASSGRSCYDGLAIPEGDLWVFGYGSLMWQPGFPHAESSPARLYGYHRALCIQSIRYRGTPDVPGLVLGLDRGGSCTGVGFRVSSVSRDETLRYLEDREMLHDVYFPAIKTIVLGDRQSVPALTFIVKRQHSRYTRDLTPAQAAAIVSRASGDRGANLDYVQASIDKLEAMGVRDLNLSLIGDLARGNAG